MFVQIHNESLRGYLNGTTAGGASVFDVLAGAWQSLIDAGVIRGEDGKPLDSVQVSFGPEGLRLTRGSEEVSRPLAELPPFEGSVEALAYTLHAIIGHLPEKPWTRN